MNGDCLLDHSRCPIQAQNGAHEPASRVETVGGHALTSMISAAVAHGPGLVAPGISAHIAGSPRLVDARINAPIASCPWLVEPRIADGADLPRRSTVTPVARGTGLVDTRI